MPPRSVEYVVFVTRGEEERLELRMDLFIYEESLPVKFNLPGEDVIRGTPIGRNVAKNMMFSAWLPFQESIEGVVITEIEILLEIDGARVPPDVAGGSGDPPMRIEPELVVLWVAVVGRHTFQGRKTEQHENHKQRYDTSKPRPCSVLHRPASVLVFSCGA